MKAASDAILRPEQAAYLEALEPPRDALLAKMEARAAERGYPVSDPEVASFLAVTARGARPRFIVELGTNIGYGAIVLARAAGPDARVLTFELSHDLCEEARGFIAEAGLEARITVRQGAALHELEKVEQPIDLAYIDCVKEEYPRYLELLVPRLSPHGIIVADNTLWYGHVARSVVPEAQRERTEALRAFNLALVQHPLLRAVVLPLGDGVAYAVKMPAVS
ncbi:O-methyltransferase [Pendulispora albinea]|uniref:O-methyltransferase n=1 Tax=Pendulispora albinea TaxID=2741071 RepID=A0ABZ2M375_9BACT